METSLTAIEFLQKLPEPIKTKALSAAESQCLETANMPVDTISMALSVAFLWDKTREGRAYWLEVSYKSLLGESLETLNIQLP